MWFLDRAPKEEPPSPSSPSRTQQAITHSHRRQPFADNLSEFSAQCDQLRHDERSRRKPSSPATSMPSRAFMPPPPRPFSGASTGRERGIRSGVPSAQNVATALVPSRTSSGGRSNYFMSGNTHNSTNNNNTIGIARGMGRGVHVNRPAWMTQKSCNISTVMPPPRLPPPPPPAAAAADHSATMNRQEQEQEELLPSPRSTGHVVFCIDYSGSMREKDVEEQGGKKTSRWDAVFSCTDYFIARQLRDSRGISNEGKASQVDYSLVIFNTKSEIVFDRVPLEDGVRVRQHLKDCNKERSPTGGTEFAPAFKLVRDMVKGSTGPIMLLFLTDGRPADLNVNGHRAGMPIQQTYRSHKKVHPSAAVHIQGLLKDHGDRLKIQFICIHKDGQHWMRRLANEYSQQFHMAGLRIEDVTAGAEHQSESTADPPAESTTVPPAETTSTSDTARRSAAGAESAADPSAEIPGETGHGTARRPASGPESTADPSAETTDTSAAAAAAAASETSSESSAARNSFNEKQNGRDFQSSDDDSDVDDDSIEYVDSKTAEDLINERRSAAEANGQVVSLTSTFLTLSQETTTMMTSQASSSRPMRERQVTIARGKNVPEVKYEATLMKLSADRTRFVVPPREKPNGRIVSLATQPFAQGGLRTVYAMKEAPKPGQPVRVLARCAKESRFEVPYAQRLAFHEETSRCQARAIELASSFNKAVREAGSRAAVPRIRIITTEVYRLKDSTSAGGFRYLAVEERLYGTYVKFNSNNGSVRRLGENAMPSEHNQLNVANAFSHYTYETTNREEIVVDIQGVGFCYTDPAIHSKKREFGRSDIGERGMATFFKTHKCNDICRAIGLKNREPITVDDD